MLGYRLKPWTVPEAEWLCGQIVPPESRSPGTETQDFDVLTLRPIVNYGWASLPEGVNLPLRQSRTRLPEAALQRAVQSASFQSALLTIEAAPDESLRVCTAQSHDAIARAKKDT